MEPITLEMHVGVIYAVRYRLTKDGNQIILTGSDGSRTQVTDSDTVQDVPAIVRDILIAGGYQTAADVNAKISTEAGVRAAADAALAEALDGKAAAQHTHQKSEVGLGSVDNTSDADKPVSTATQTALDGKADKVAGKGLSTNDFTDAYKEKLDGIAAGAQVNAIETVKVNGNALSPSEKAVNIPVPTKVSDLTNDSGFQTSEQVAAAVAVETYARQAADTSLAADIDKALVHSTISGERVVFDDGADLPVKSLEVSFSSVSPISDITVKRGGKNLLPPALLKRGVEMNGVTLTQYEDGHYSLSGTATGGAFSHMIELLAPITLTSGMYAAMGNTDTDSGVAIYLRAEGGMPGDTLVEHTPTSLHQVDQITTSGTATLIGFYVDVGHSVDITFFPMVVATRGEADGFEPYIAPATWHVDIPDEAGEFYSGKAELVSGVLTIAGEGGAPVEYSLEPQNIRTVRGTNAYTANVTNEEFSDVTISMTYRTDASLRVPNAAAISSWAEVQRIVRAGRAREYFSVGDQLSCVRGDEVLVWDIVAIDFDKPYTPFNQYTHSLTLCLHDCFSGGRIPPSTKQALFYFPSGLAAGTYNFKVTWNNYASGDVGKTFQFTTTQAIPAGGQFRPAVSWDQSFANRKAETYASASATAKIEEVTMTEGSGGTALGDVGQYPSGNTNALPRVLLGNGTYSQSGIRCFINSSGAAGSAWAPQSVWDRPPEWASNTAGFLYRMDEDFLAVVGDVEKRTMLYDGSINISSEKFFLLSRAEVYAYTTGMYGEGQAYPYFSEYSDFSTPSQYHDSNRIKNMNDTATAWALRTTDSIYSMYYISTQGDRSSSDTTQYRGVVPACCIV